MKKLVIIGGGFAGSSIAKKLEKKFETTLIDTKDYFEFTPSILRTIVNPSHMTKIQKPHEKYLKRTKFIHGKVTDINNNSIFIGKKQIKFDYCIIASGSFYNTPIKESDIVLATRAEHLKENYEKLCESKKVLIIGGGIVGVELAAEISTHYNDKEITLIHSRARLMDRFPIKASKYIEKFLKKHNVNLILNDRVLESKNKTHITKNKLKIKPDIVFAAVGISPNSDFMDNFKSSLNEKKFIKVSPTLQLKNKKNIFAVGDVNDCGIEKTAQNAEAQAKLAIKNILNLEKNKPLENYKIKANPLVVSLGKYNGILIYKNFTLKGIIPALLKFSIEKKEMWKK